MLLVDEAAPVGSEGEQAALRVATGPGFQFAGVTDRVLRQVSRPLGR